MASITVGGDYSIDMADFDFYVDDLTSAKITKFTSTLITGTLDGTKITIKGSGFQADSNGLLVAGTIKSIGGVEAGKTVFLLSGVSISVQKIFDLVENGTAAAVKAFVQSTFKGGDIIHGGASDDVILGYAGDDKLFGGGDADKIYGGSGKDYINGGDGADMLNGGSGNDTLLAGVGNDILKGGAGDDLLQGSAGADRLWGGAGADTFQFKSIANSMLTGQDTIYDFARSEGDKIDLKTIDANVKVSGNQAFSFIGSDGFHKKAGELRYEHKSGDTFIQGDVNGDGKIDFSVKVDALVNFAKGDFLL